MDNLESGTLQDTIFHLMWKRYIKTYTKHAILKSLFKGLFYNQKDGKVN